MRKPVKMGHDQEGKPTGPHDPNGGDVPNAVPDYIADLCGGLVKMAEGAKLHMLAYLLGVAKLEAETVSHKGGERAGR